MRVILRLVLLAAIAAAAVAGATVATAGGYHLEYTFAGGADGEIPSGDLIEVRGKFYGTTHNGGSPNCGAGCGTVFSLDPATGAETVVYALKGGADAANPLGGLIKVGTLLYGTTFSGGSSNCGGLGCGAIFSVDPTTGAEAMVYAFKGAADGEGPYNRLTERDGMLYGTTIGGGASGAGTVFSIDPATGVETVLYSFTGGADGGNPTSDLLAANGRLYGTTTGGGLSKCGSQGGCGTVFYIDLATGEETVAYAFKGGADGALPHAGLIKIAGKLYGTTIEGGVLCDAFGFGCGTVFSLETTTGAESVLYSFGGRGDGDHPYGGLLDVGGTLYGTTTNGTAVKFGTVFALDPKTLAEQVLHVFKRGADGKGPQARLLYWRRRLYGTTSTGGNAPNCGSGCGTVFSVRP